MERPWQIRYFEVLMLGAVALGVARSVLIWDEIARTSNIGLTLLVQVFAFGLTIVLTLLVSRRRSRIAMWILIALFLLSLLGVLGLMSSGMAQGSWLLTILQLLAELMALILLFTRPAQLWLEHKPSSV